MNCPCGSQNRYEVCCKPMHTGEEIAETAVQLMQSRYCAFVVKAYDYLEETTDPQTTFNFDHKGNQEWGDSVEFQKLEILNSEEIRNKASVEFKAHFKKDGELHVHHELSRFRRLEGVWYFRDGKLLGTDA